ncbi:glycosyl hydrolase family 71-domain-containing protein [Aspergillus karnatakaensis]|uniref:glycosyl hydrolase family 71-domain-containing protein n=1 Tax=Aspergillus karnatakaensis TaxID=1810916 RepID=UPI003CCCD123
MKLLAAFASALACGASLAEAKAVFAHFMVGNTKSLGLDDWRTEIMAAQGAGIDAFALNMASGDPTNDIALPKAFTAAYDMGFQLLFSFDYAGNGPWDKSVVIDMIKEYGSKETYFKKDGDPFVSTFEGPNNADDWKDIKKETGCFFIPDWSSVGAQPAVNLGDGIADGLFSWDAWPKGPANVTTYPDASYYDFLGSKPYMMPISPWFYTNLPGYDKNWLWRGDDMWFQRWQQAISLDRQPDWIQIISWNDYGESHYIGPLDDRQYEAFDIGRAPFNYVKDMPHDGWRETLPYYISMYKSGSATVEDERLVSWYRVNKHGACSDGGTTGNTANQLQLEYAPSEMMEDRVFYDVLLGSDAQVQVSIGGVVQAGTWDQEPHGGVGVYHGSVPIGTASGPVVVTVKRGDTTIATISGASITSGCTAGLNNYNPWVGSARGPSIDPVKTTGNLDKLDCVKGFGVYEFVGVCDFACSNGYCPSAACTCLEKGVANAPNETGDAGYPLPGKSGSFAGLCSFNCNHGYCPDTVCGQTPNDGVVLDYSPFLPPACTGGTGDGAFQGLCILVQTPAKTDVTGYYLDSSVNDYGLCKFACEHGYCPDICGSRPIDDDGEDDQSKYPTVTLDPAVWNTPTAQCAPPCVLVLPPSSLAEPTTISFNPWKTSLEFGWTTTDTVDGTRSTHYTAITVTTEISIPPVTTTLISFSDVILTTTVDGAVPSVITPTASISPPPFVLKPTSIPDVDATPVSRTIRPPPWPWTAAGAVGTSTTTTTPDPIDDIPIETGPFPTTVFPTESISWVSEWVPEPTATEVGGDGPTPVIPCFAWFIWSCPPHVGGIVLPGFREPGIYPPGGPPPLAPNPPPGLTLKAPWPRITIGTDRKPTYPEKPDQDENVCETATASVCTTTLSYGIVAKRTVAPTAAPGIATEEFVQKLTKRATTTTTSTISFCTQVTGCGATDITSTSSIESTATTNPRVVIPRDPGSVDGIRTTLQQQLGGAQPELFESRTDALGTLFFFVPAFTDDQTAAIRGHAQVADAYIPRGQLTLGYWGALQIPTTEGGLSAWDDEEDSVLDILNSTKRELYERSNLVKRSEIFQSDQEDYMVSLSWPAGIGPVPQRGDFRFDSSAGEGTYVYDLDYGATPSHPEFSDVLFLLPIHPGPNPVSSWMENDPNRHGTSCLSKAVGKTVGIARKATVIATVWDFQGSINEHWLDGLAKVHDDILRGRRGDKSVVNLSISIPQGHMSAAFQDKMALVIREIINLGAVFVTGSGNRAEYPYGYPALFGDPSDRNHIPELIVVGSVLGSGALTTDAKAPWVTCYAPGVRLRVATPDDNFGDYRTGSGTSLASATVAGLAAYFRGLDDELDTAASVKQRIVDLAYRRTALAGHRPEWYLDNVVWNGQKNGRSYANECGSSTSNTKRQTSSGSCPVAFPPEAQPLTFRTGSPQPTCAGTGCGSACGSGFFCAGSPLQENPDFLDPRNPDSVQNPDSPYYEDWEGTITRTTTRTTTTTSTRTSTSTSAPTSTGTPIGGSCSSAGQCTGDCSPVQALDCIDGECKCRGNQGVPPYGTQCQSVQSCLDFYNCDKGDSMVCEERDYSHGAPLCLCIKGSD